MRQTIAARRFRPCESALGGMSIPLEAASVVDLCPSLGRSLVAIVDALDTQS